MTFLRTGTSDIRWYIGTALSFRRSTHYTFRGGASHIGERSGPFFVFIVNPYDYGHWSVGAALDCFILSSSWWLFWA